MVKLMNNVQAKNMYTIYAFGRNFKTTCYLNTYPYNDIYNNFLHNVNMSIFDILVNYRSIFKDNNSNSTQFIISRKESQTMNNVIHFASIFSKCSQDFMHVFANENFKAELATKINNKEDFEVLFMKLKKKDRMMNDIIKSRYLYISVKWKRYKKYMFLNKTKATITIINQTKGYVNTYLT